MDPLGLYDLDRRPRAVGKAYKQLIADWRDVLPAQSRCLAVPLAAPGDRGAPGQGRSGTPRRAPGPIRDAEG